MTNSPLRELSGEDRQKASETDRAPRAALALARQHTLSVSDAADLELAMRESLPIASLDKPLVAAAKAIGVPIFTP